MNHEKILEHPVYMDPVMQVVLLTFVPQVNPLPSADRNGISTQSEEHIDLNLIRQYVQVFHHLVEFLMQDTHRCI